MGAGKRDEERTAFNTKRMPEKWRPHFKIYRAKISIYLDTADFGTPLMVDASEMMDLLPPGIDHPSFVHQTGPLKPGGEALWVETEVTDGLPSRPNVRRIGAMVHHSDSRTSFMKEPWTGEDNEYMIEVYLRDDDGLSTRLEHNLRFRLDRRGFLIGMELLHYQSAIRAGWKVGDIEGTVYSDYEATDAKTASAVEAMNRVLFSLALMNCRNVSLRERRGTARSTGPGPVGDAFHEVVIDGGSRAGDSASTGTGEGRRHLARGHFKTFTDDAPLLGKHVGTYWWGWQVRGQEGRGTIEKTYALKT